MPTLIIGLMFTLLVTIPVELLSAEEISKQNIEYDFRKIRWGMTQEEVVSSEPSEPISTEDKEILFETRILENNFTLKYRFNNQQLIGATYLLEDKFLRTEYYVDTYNDFVEALANKYGEPNISEVVWLDNTYKNDPNKKNFALSAGHVQYFSSWSREKTKIKCILQGEFHNLILKIDYASVLHEEIGKEDVIKDPF